MRYAILVTASGSRLSGEYDGYGRLGSTDLEDAEEFTIYHRACWDLTGRPGFSKPAEYSYDQGFFVGEYDPRCPRSGADCDKLRVEAIEAKRQHDQMWSKLVEQVARRSTEGKA